MDTIPPISGVDNGRDIPRSATRHQSGLLVQEPFGKPPSTQDVPWSLPMPRGLIGHYPAIAAGTRAAVATRWPRSLQPLRRASGLSRFRIRPATTTLVKLMTTGILLRTQHDPLLPALRTPSLSMSPYETRSPEHRLPARYLKLPASKRPTCHPSLPRDQSIVARLRQSISGPPSDPRFSLAAVRTPVEVHYRPLVRTAKMTEDRTLPVRGSLHAVDGNIGDFGAQKAGKHGPGRGWVSARRADNPP